MMLCHVDVRWNCVSWGQYCCCTVIFSFVFMVLLLRLNIKSEEKHNLHDFFFPRMEKYKVKIVKFSSRMWNRILYFNWNMRLFLRSEITWGRNIEIQECWLSWCPLTSSCRCLIGFLPSARMLGCQEVKLVPASLKLSCEVTRSSQQPQCVVRVVVRLPAAGRTHQVWACCTDSPHSTILQHCNWDAGRLDWAGLGQTCQNYSSSSSVKKSRDFK